MFGIEPNEVPPNADTFYAFVHPDDREGVMVTSLPRWGAKEGGFEAEYRIIRRGSNGEIHHVYSKGGHVRDSEGQPVRSVGTIQDITERKRAEEEKAKLEGQLQQAQKMESVGRLAGGVAHDFNNMLGVILGHAELALEQVGPAQPLHADLVEIRKAAQRSADLTRQLLAFARKQTIAPKVLDLNETVAGMLKMLRRLIGEDIDLAWQPGADLWPVKMDPSQIDQILANLCVNARDAIAGVGQDHHRNGKQQPSTRPTAPITPGFVPGRVRAARRERRRLRHGQGDAGPHLRAVLHDQGAGQGHRPRAGHGLRHRQAEQRLHQRLQRAGTGNDVHDLSAPARGQGRADAAGRPGGTGRSAGHETILLVEDEPAILDMTQGSCSKAGLHRAGRTHAGRGHPPGRGARRARFTCS